MVKASSTYHWLLLMAFRVRSQVNQSPRLAHVLFIPPLCLKMPPKKIHISLLSIFSYLFAAQFTNFPRYFHSLPCRSFSFFLLITLYSPLFTSFSGFN